MDRIHNPPLSQLTQEVNQLGRSVAWRPTMRRVCIGGVVLGAIGWVTGMTLGPNRISLLWQKSLIGCSWVGAAVSSYFIVTHNHDEYLEDRFLLSVQLMSLWTLAYPKKDPSDPAQKEAQLVINRYKLFCLDLMIRSGKDHLPWTHSQIIETIKAFPFLQRIELQTVDDIQVDDEVLEAISKQKEVSILNLGRAENVSHGGMGVLKNLSLTELYMAACSLEAYDCLEDFKNTSITVSLAELGLGKNISDSQLKSLSYFPNLKRVRILDHVQLSMNSLISLAQLPKLEDLSITFSENFAFDQVNWLNELQASSDEEFRAKVQPFIDQRFTAIEVGYPIKFNGKGELEFKSHEMLTWEQLRVRKDISGVDAFYLTKAR